MKRTNCCNAKPLFESDICSKCGEHADLIFNVEFWVNTSNGYDNRDIDIKTDNEANALIEAKRLNPRGKNFKINAI